MDTGTVISENSITGCQSDLALLASLNSCVCSYRASLSFTIKRLKPQKSILHRFLIVEISFLSRNMTGYCLYEEFLEDEIGYIDCSQGRFIWVFRSLLVSLSSLCCFWKTHVYFIHMFIFFLFLCIKFSVSNLFLSLLSTFPSFRTIFLWKYCTILFLFHIQRSLSS